jgi:ABC-type transport system involved in multi-copper enzyme maturation permease subunit
VAANTFRETVRERVLYNLVFFAALMTLSGLLLQDLSLDEDVKIIKDVGLAAMDLFGTAIALLMGVGLVNKEIERRSIYPLLAKPLGRGELLVGKFAGLSFTLLVNVSVMALGLYATLWATGRTVGPELLLAVLPLYVGLCVVVALALLFSALTSTTLAAVCTLLLVLAGRSSDVLKNAEYLATGIPAPVTRTLYVALPNFRAFDLKEQAVYGLPVAAGELGSLCLYGAVYAAMLLTLAYVSLRFREL